MRAKVRAMNSISRRRLLEGAAVSTSSLAAVTGIARAEAAAAAAPAPAGAPAAARTGASPAFGPFRFALGEQTPKVIDGNWAKEATVAEFPISAGVAGVLMSLKPGACASCTGTPTRQNGPTSS